MGRSSLNKKRLAFSVLLSFDTVLKKYKKKSLKEVFFKALKNFLLKSLRCKAVILIDSVHQSISKKIQLLLAVIRNLISELNIHGRNRRIGGLR